MDGNGRWAKQRGLPRQLGHERGVETLRRTVEACRNLDLEHLTVFSFSSENDTLFFMDIAARRQPDYP